MPERVSDRPIRFTSIVSMSEPSKPSPGNSSGGQKPPVAKASWAGAPKAKPPVVAAPADAQPAPAPIPMPGPVFLQPAAVNSGSFAVKPAPPVPTPRNTKGIGLIIGLVVGLPLIMLLACGVGGYLIVNRASKSVANAAKNVKNQNGKLRVDPSDPFAALNNPDIQDQLKQEMTKAFDKLDEDLKKQQAADAAKQKGRNTRAPGNGNNNSSGPRAGFTGPVTIPANPAFPRPGEELDDVPTNLKRLQTGNDDAKRRAAEWFGRVPLETDKQEEVSKALNNMHTESLRKHALGALKVWGTKENVPIIAKIMQQEAFVKIDCMDMLEKFKDERAIEPLISTLNEAFREGERAEEILGDWWPQAEQPLVKHLHDKEGRIRERTHRILELRKTDQGLLIAQTLEDIKSANRDVRKSAVEWLAKLEVKADLQPQVAAAAQPLLTDSNNDIRRHAAVMFGKYAQKEQADELLKLVDENDRERWMAGLTGLVRLGDERVAEKVGRRKEIRGDAFRLFRETGAPAQDIVSKTFPHIEVKDWGAGKDLCEILGDIGTSKSVGVLQLVKKRATAAKTPFVGDAADKAIESIRRRNAG